MRVLVRGLCVFLGLLGASIFLANFIRLSAFEVSWVLPLVGALGVEVVLWTCRYERAVVGHGRGKILLGLRLVEFVLLLWILAQPVWSVWTEREIQREVVVLVDDSASMSLVDEGESRTRLELATEVLKRSGLMDGLKGKVGVSELRFARRALDGDLEAGEGWEQGTDLAGGLESVLTQVPLEQLAGVVLLSDGRHNRSGSVEDMARRFGVLDVPIAVIASGSEVPPKDAAIMRVQSPDSVFLGDRIRADVLLNFEGYRGGRARVQLFAGEEEVDSQEIRIPQDQHREEVKLRHRTVEGGVSDYRVVLSELESETFKANNSWDFQTVVSDARTNVLLIDEHPRWEFRYLRNLFYGRDQSVHLQSVLVKPDRIAGQRPVKVAASASRPFGDANATDFPENEKEWRKFDVIIIGDVGPGSLSDKEWEIIDQCVKERGALLVLIAGPESMPHAFSGKVLRGLVPVEYENSRRTYYGGDEVFRFGLTSAGREHVVTRQVDGRVENEALWREFPKIRWRHPIEGLQAGAEVLFYAERADVKGTKVNSASGLDEALKELASRREWEAKNALFVTRQTGAGKVAMLLTDRMWRLREGVGDVYHHRFWRQLIRWGAGPNLRAGNEQVRLGTDGLTYTGDDQVQIMSRLRDAELNPLIEDDLVAEVIDEGGAVVRVPLVFRKGSNGFYEGYAGPFVKPGQYEVRLRDEVMTSFRVVGAHNAEEFSETTLNRDLLERVVHLSGGRFFQEGEGLAELYLRGDETHNELREKSLWDVWPILLVFFLLVALEWTIRKGWGLS